MWLLDKIKSFLQKKEKKNLLPEPPSQVTAGGEKFKEELRKSANENLTPEQLSIKLLKSLGIDLSNPGFKDELVQNMKESIRSPEDVDKYKSMIKLIELKGVDIAVEFSPEPLSGLPERTFCL